MGDRERPLGVTPAPSVGISSLTRPGARLRCTDQARADESRRFDRGFVFSWFWNAQISVSAHGSTHQRQFLFVARLASQDALVAKGRFQARQWYRIAGPGHRDCLPTRESIWRRLRPGRPIVREPCRYRREPPLEPRDNVRRATSPVVPASMVPASESRVARLGQRILHQGLVF